MGECLFLIVQGLRHFYSLKRTLRLGTPTVGINPKIDLLIFSQNIVFVFVCSLAHSSKSKPQIVSVQNIKRSEKNLLKTSQA